MTREIRTLLPWIGVAAFALGSMSCSFIRDFDQFAFDEDAGPGSSQDATVPGVETCDGTDEDGDGEIDEDITRPCGTDVGECSAGVETCTDGQFGACEGSVEPAAEVCDGSADEDCDGSIDEGCACTPGAEQPCGSDVGECSFGTQLCQADGTWSACMGGRGPMNESCDGVDNDCDGTTDEAPAAAECMYGCNEAAGRCNLCPVGGRECTDSMTLRTCLDGTDWTMEGCMYGCNAVRDECNVCAPNSVQCVDADNEQQCLADGSGWRAPTSCEFGCNATSRNRCRQCDPSAGTYQCSTTDPNTRSECSASGFYTASVNCPVVFPGPAPNGCNPATGRCYHQ